MQLNIVPIRDKMLTCFQNIVANVAYWWGREYTLAFTDSWGFSFEPISEQKKTFGERLINGWYADAVDLETNTGICVHIHNDFDSNGLLDFIKQELYNCRPIIIKCDSFWCNWGSVYQKYHLDHYYLITGIDKTGRFSFIDPFWTEDVKSIQYSELIKNCVGLYTFELVTDKQPYVDWKQTILKLTNSPFTENNSNNMFEEMRQFSNEVKYGIDANAERQGHNEIFMIPLYHKIFRLESGRYNFGKLFRYYAENGDAMGGKYYENFNYVGSIWSKIRLSIHKIFITPCDNDIFYKISDNVKFIADYEEQMAEELFFLCEAESFPTKLGK